MFVYSRMLQTFQFHKGSINISDSGFKVFSIGSFNSIKVRLICAAYGKLMTWLKFQFHKGSINIFMNI
jgi:hypothetical protein